MPTQLKDTAAGQGEVVVTKINRYYVSRAVTIRGSLRGRELFSISPEIFSSVIDTSAKDRPGDIDGSVNFLSTRSSIPLMDYSPRIAQTVRHYTNVPLSIVSKCCIINVLLLSSACRKIYS